MTEKDEKSGNESFRLSFGDTSEGSEGEQVDLNPAIAVDDQFLWHNSAALLDGIPATAPEPAIGGDAGSAPVDETSLETAPSVETPDESPEIETLSTQNDVVTSDVAGATADAVSVQDIVAAQEHRAEAVAPAVLEFQGPPEPKKPVQDGAAPIDVLALGTADMEDSSSEELPDVLQPAILSQPEPTGTPWLMYATLGLGAALLVGAVAVGVSQRGTERLASVAQPDLAPAAETSGEKADDSKIAQADKILASLDPDLVSAQVVVGTMSAGPNRDQQGTLLPNSADPELSANKAPLRVDQSRDVASAPEIMEVTRVETPIATSLSLPGQPAAQDDVAMVVPKSIGFASATPASAELDLPSVKTDPLPEVKGDQRGVTKKLSALRTAAIEKRNTALQGQIKRVSDGIGQIGMAGQSLAPEIETASLVMVSDTPPNVRGPMGLASVDEKALSSDAFEEVALPTRPNLDTAEPEAELVDVAALDVDAPALEGRIADALTTATPPIAKPSAAQTSAGSVGTNTLVTALAVPAQIDGPIREAPQQENIEVAAIPAPSLPQATDEAANATEEATELSRPEVEVATAPTTAPEPLVESKPETEFEVATVPVLRPELDQPEVVTPSDDGQAADDTQIMFIATDPGAQAAPKPAPKVVELPTSPFVTTAGWRTPLNITSLDVETSDASVIVATASPEAGLPDWATDGAIIRSVNGVPVSTPQEFYDALLIEGGNSTGQITAFLTIQSSAEAESEDVRVDLQFWRYIALKDGTEIEISRKSGKWRAEVIRVGFAVDEGIAAGDVLVRDYATKTKIDAPLVLEKVLAELEETADLLGFAVVRDGALSDAGIVLTTEE